MPRPDGAGARASGGGGGGGGPAVAEPGRPARPQPGARNAPALAPSAGAEPRRAGRAPRPPAAPAPPCVNCWSPPPPRRSPLAAVRAASPQPPQEREGDGGREGGGKGRGQAAAGPSPEPVPGAGEELRPRREAPSGGRLALRASRGRVPRRPGSRLPAAGNATPHSAGAQTPFFLPGRVSPPGSPSVRGPGGGDRAGHRGRPWLKRPNS